MGASLSAVAKSIYYFIKEAKLSNYTDDNQLYFADTDPAVVEHVLNKELVVVCGGFVITR